MYLKDNQRVIYDYLIKKKEILIEKSKYFGQLSLQII